MAERIHDSGTGYYNSQARGFQPTLQIPMLVSPVLRGYVEDEMGRIRQDTKNVQENISKFRKVKDSVTGLDLSPANLERFEKIRDNQYGINEDLANIRPEEFRNPVMMDALENKYETLFKDPEVKRILGSEAYADKFFESTFQIGDEKLRAKAKKDYYSAVDKGYEAMLGLNINNYKPLNPNEFILDLSKNLPEERLTEDKNGYRYTYDRISDEGIENLKKQMQYKYDTDERFRNNFDTQYGSNYENVSEYIDYLNQQGSFLEPVGRPVKITPNNSDTGSEQKTFNDYKKESTKIQKDFIDWYSNVTGGSLADSPKEGVVEALRVIASREGESAMNNWSGDKLISEIEKVIGGGTGPTKEERVEKLRAEGKFIPADADTEIDITEIQDYEDDMDMSHWPVLGVDGVFGDGTANNLLEAIKEDKYKGSIDDDGNLITSNIRWLYEEYYGKTQEIGEPDSENLKELIDNDPNVEFIPKGKGQEAHFKIKGQAGAVSQPNETTGNVKQGDNNYAYGLEMVSINPDEYPTVSGTTFNKPVSKPLLDKVKPILEGNNLVITEGRDSDSHRDKRQQNGVSIDVDFNINNPSATKIKEVIDSGKSNGLEFVYEVKTKSERDKLIQANKDLEGHVIVVPHASGSHFSVYEKPFAATYGSHGRVKEGSLSAKTNNPLNLTDTGYGSMHYKTGETADNSGVPFYRRPEQGLAVGYAKISAALSREKKDDGVYWGDMTLEQFSDKFAEADTDITNLVDWLNKVAKEDYGASDDIFNKDTPLYQVISGLGDEVSVGLDGFIKAMLGKELSPEDYDQLVNNYKIFDNINESNYQKFLKGDENTTPSNTKVDFFFDE